MSTSPIPARSILPADPWRRWGAAALDTLLLWIGHLVIWISSVLILPEGEWKLRVPLVMAAFSGLAYLVVLWKIRGATLGQEALGLRVVRYDGQPLTWDDAFRRLGGYLLAALPFHLGFLSIFWDPYRRGWHDFIAQTLVIRHPSDFRPLPLPPPSTPESALPEAELPPFVGPQWGIVILLYIGLAICFTYPLARHFSTHCAGDGTDAPHFMWSFWHTQQALWKGRESLLTTNSLFFPLPTTLLYYSACWAYALPAALVLQWLTLTQTFNLFFIFSLVASGFLTFLLARALGCGVTESFLAGLLFGFSPYMMAHGASGHLELLAGEFIALFALLCYRGLMCFSARRVLAAGMALALVGYGSWYYLAFAGFMLVSLAIGMALGSHPDFRPGSANPSWFRRGASLGLRAAFIGLCGTLFLSPLLLPMLQERARERSMDMPLAVSEIFSLDVAFVAFSNPLHPLWGKWVANHLRPGAEQVAGLSLIALGLSGVALWKYWRKLFLWGLTGAFLGVLACGPRLQVAQRELQLPSWLLLLAGGPPGNGLGLPWRADLSLDCGRSFTTTPDLFWKKTCSFHLPYVWLHYVCPPLRPLRAPARFIVITSLCVAVLAAWGLRWVRHTARQRWGKKEERLIVLLVVGGVLWEYLPIPYPITSTAVSQFYHQLAREPKPCAILEVPVDAICRYNFHQTIHGQPLFFGFHSRPPSQALAFQSRNRLLAAFSPWGDYREKRPLGIDQSNVETIPLSVLRQQFEPSLQELSSLGGRYIIVHKPQLREITLRRTDQLLGKALSLPICWEDPAIRVYRVSAANPQPARQKAP